MTHWRFSGLRNPKNFIEIKFAVLYFIFFTPMRSCGTAEKSVFNPGRVTASECFGSWGKV